MPQTQHIPLTHDALEAALARKALEVAREPEHRWGDRFQSFMADDEGKPVVRLAAANCALDLDLWQGLRNPAQAGLYPLGLSDIWMHYAASNVRSTRFDGSPNPLAMPEPYEEACARMTRAVIISAMLPINPGVFEAYADKIEQGDADCLDYYCRARAEVGTIIGKAVSKLGLALMAPNRAVVPMTNKTAATVADRTRSEYFEGKYHGPCNSPYPQNSIAVMAGLLRFGISRLPFRDEVRPDGSVQRLFGQYASIVVFDDEAMVADGAGGVLLLDADCLAWKRRVNDYSDEEPEVAAERFCTYNVPQSDGASICGKCVDACPSGALSNSSPSPAGEIEERVRNQKHRFQKGALKFDFGTCNRERKQKAQLYDDYVCARCEAICAARGVRRPAREIAEMAG